MKSPSIKILPDEGTTIYGEDAWGAVIVLILRVGRRIVRIYDGPQSGDDYIDYGIVDRHGWRESPYDNDIDPNSPEGMALAFARAYFRLNPSQT